MRTDFSPEFSVLFDGESGYGYQLAHPLKAYIRLPLVAMGLTNSCGGASNVVVHVATGRSQTIGGRTAREHLVSSECANYFAWVVPDYPDWQQFRNQQAANLLPDHGGGPTASTSRVIHMLTFIEILVVPPAKPLRAATASGKADNTFAFSGRQKFPSLVRCIEPHSNPPRASSSNSAPASLPTTGS